jgi:glycosyltransferase involved in cell wall biosynthesis
VPRVSIGLPVYNGDRFLAATIESLLEQTYKDFELILADNASTDGTEDICREYARRDPRVQYHRSEVNLGAAWNFNRSFHLARGEYFKWAAHDDLHHPQFVDRCVQVLDRDASVILCFTRTEFIDGEGRSLGEYRFPVDVNTADRRALFLVYAAGGHIVHEIFGVIRTQALRESPLIGRFVGSDHVLLGTLALRGRFHQVPELLFQHREHEGRSTRSTGGARGYTQWFDPSRTDRFVMPHWRRVFENARSILNAPLEPRDKAASFWDLCRAMNWNRRALGAELRRLGRV